MVQGQHARVPHRGEFCVEGRRARTEVRSGCGGGGADGGVGMPGEGRCAAGL